MVLLPLCLWIDLHLSVLHDQGLPSLITLPLLLPSFCQIYLRHRSDPVYFLKLKPLMKVRKTETYINMIKLWVIFFFFKSPSMLLNYLYNIKNLFQKWNTKSLVTPAELKFIISLSAHYLILTHLYTSVAPLSSLRPVLPSYCHGPFQPASEGNLLGRLFFLCPVLTLVSSGCVYQIIRDWAA